MSRKKNIGTPVSGVIDTQYNDDSYATHISKKGRGGPFQARNLEEMLAIPVDRLYFNAKCTVSEDTVNARPRTTYVLKRLPLQNQSDPTEVLLEQPARDQAQNYNVITLTTDESNEGFFLNYWVMESEAQAFDGEYEEQFAPDYDGSYYTDNSLEDSIRPPFPYTKDSAWHTSNWNETQNLSIHSWMRIRYGADGKWSRPFRIFAKPEMGDELTSRFRWVLTSSGAPTKPKFMQPDGLTVNTEPSGWSDIPPAKPVGNYTLWEIRGVLNGFGELKRPWEGPFKIPMDGNLVRYSANATPNPNSIVDTFTDASFGTQGDTDLNNANWFAEPQPNTQYRAKRSEVSGPTITYTEWIVEQIGGEGGLTKVNIYRLFPKTLINHIVNNPDAEYLIADGGDGKPFRPEGESPANWTDAQVANPPDNMVNFISEAWFYNSGRKKTKWSDPTPVSPDDLFNLVIDSGGVNNFRFNANAVTKRDVTSITLTAKLFRGLEELLPTNETLSYQWTRIRNGSVVSDTNFGTTQAITISPSDVDQLSTFEVTVTLSDGKGNDKSFTERMDILDVSDGENARALSLRTPSNLFSSRQGASHPSSIVLEGFPLNLVYPDDGTATRWYYGAAVDGPWTQIPGETGKTLTVTPTDFVNSYNGGNSEGTVYFKMEIDDTVTGTTFSDVTSITKIDLEDGLADSFVLLSNDFQQVPVNSDGTLVSSTPELLYFTRYQVWVSGVDETANYNAPTVTVSVLDDGGVNTTVTTDNDGIDKIWITAWGSSVIEANVEIELTGSGLPTLRKRWRLQRVYNGSGVILLADIDVDDSSPSPGFYFKPGGFDSKVLKAVAYLNGEEVTDYTGYSFLWNAEGLVSASQTFSITRNDVDVVLDVELTITGPGGIGAQARVKIEDIPDSVGLDELFYPGEEFPDKPDEVAGNYDVYSVTDITGSKSAGQPINITVDFSKSQSVIVSAYDTGGADWFIEGGGSVLVDPIEGVGFPFDTYYQFGYYLKYDNFGNTGLTNITLKPKSATSANTKLKVIVTDNYSRWIPVITAETIWKSQKRSNEDETQWSDPFRIVGERGALGKSGGFYATFISIHPTSTTSVQGLAATVAPEEPRTTTLKTSIPFNGTTWYSEGNVPSYNKYTERTWKTQKLVRFDENDNYISSSVDEWTTPRPFGGTDGLKADQPVFIFRRSATKPTGSDLPINGLTIEESGGAKWTASIPVGADQLWMCKASFENNVITDVYEQQENWSAPVAFEAVGSKTVALFHPVINNDPRDQPPPPTANPDTVLSSTNSYTNGTWVKDANSITAGWKAEAYYNGSWSVWFISPMQGLPGSDGKDGSVWREFSGINVNTETNVSYNTNGLYSFVRSIGVEGDYAIIPGGQYYRKTSDTTNTYLLSGRVGNRFWAYDELSIYVSTAGSLVTTQPSGIYGDGALPGDKTIRIVQTSSETKLEVWAATSFSSTTYRTTWAKQSETIIPSGTWEDSSWNELTAISGGSPTGVQYRKDRSGVVHFRGVANVANNASNFHLATLPLGYRPYHGDTSAPPESSDSYAYSKYITASPLLSDINAPLGSIKIMSNGRVLLTDEAVENIGANTPLSFNGISYFADSQ